MDVNWTTFLFEIANFLILVWIVWRFLYRPVREILDRRSKAIEDDIAAANETRAEADRIRERYESRLTDWQSEKEDARRKFEDELQKERSARLEALAKEIEERTRAARLLEEKRLADQQDEAEKRAAEQGARFAARLLSLAATPELEHRLLDMVLKDVAASAAEPGEDRSGTLGDGPVTVQVTSAFELRDEDRKALERAVADGFGEKLSFHYARDPELIAGVRVSVGALEWRATLRDELHYFAESIHGEP